jgi:hypothetical protein
MAGAGMMTSGPTPWWQLPEYKGSRANLEQSAPAGYEYDAVKMGYQRTPTAAGQRGNDFFNALTGASGLPGSLSALNGGGGGTGSASGAFTSSSSSGSGGGAPLAAPQAPDMTASNAATFARAKDQAGQIARASLNALNGEMGAQGMLGSGAQVQGSRDIIRDGMGLVGNVSRENAIQDAQMKGDFAKLGYTGNITMRGQDIQRETAQAQLKLAEQDRYMKMLSLLLQSVGGTNSQLLY